jgi:hypothetical protein
MNYSAYKGLIDKIRSKQPVKFAKRETKKSTKNYFLGRLGVNGHN